MARVPSFAEVQESWLEDEKQEGKTLAEIEVDIDAQCAALSANYADICRDCGNMRSPHLYRHRFTPCSSPADVQDKLKDKLRNQVCWARFGENRYCGIAQDKHDRDTVPHPFMTHGELASMEKIASLKAANESATRALYASLLQ